jgi:diacylglycerol O-acyltransferase
MATPIDPQSVAFLLAESRNTPIHVGGLLLLEKPEDAGPGYVRDMYEESLKVDKVRPLFLKRPHRSLATGLQWVWTEDEQFDIEHHVRHSALPEPGRIRELLDLTSRLHGQQLSLERPLWESHLIEGLNDGRVAMYTKIHHALVDGVSAMRLLGSAFSSDPDERGMLPPFAHKAKPPRDDAGRALVRAAADVPMSAVRSALGVAAEAAGMPSALIKTLQSGARNDTASPASYAAPRSILNQRISGARRVAAQDWEIERLKRVAKATGTTLNDVVLAMSGGAMRTYLSDLGALPDASLVSMCPVGLNAKQAHVASDAGGNSVGTLMVKLGTNLDDPAARLQGIHDSMVAGKEAMESMTKAQIIAMAALGMAPLVLQPVLRLNGIMRPPFNLVISNVPGPRGPVYFNGAKLSGMYPASVPMHGQAMNITCTSYNGQMGFGLTGCRRTVPSLQRLLIHLEDALVDLERAAGVN